MSRHEESAAAPGPAENELLRRLDESLRQRATELVDDALIEAELSATRGIAAALIPVVGSAIQSSVIKHMEEACNYIRKHAIDGAYQGLVERVTAQLTDGEPVDLT